MPSGIITGFSLTASFISGILALFAPCCISFLFPAYVGGVLKDNKRVMAYTVLFGLGIASILVPAALGMRFIISFFDAYHKQVYYFGGLLLVLMGIMTLKPFFHLPSFFHPHLDVNKKITPYSVFGLGVMSGLTSSCCAPVLFTAITLTTLSANSFQAFFVALAYVLGILFPLVLLSLTYKEATRSWISGKARQTFHTVVSYIGGAVMIITGILMVVFTFQNKIQMYQLEPYSRAMRLFFFSMVKRMPNPLVDIALFILIVGVLLFILLRWDKKEKE